MILIPTWIRRRSRRTFAHLRFLYHDKVVRKPSKGICRRLLLCVVLVVAWVILRKLRQSEDQRYVQDDFLTNMALREGLSGTGEQSLNRDPRVWNGWNGINAIFAL